ncbi:MAG: 23S rRNA (pseudouridine(1915)-N(3))-methyltransferase RlmH [Peptoniphilaceae bacterium]|nr:23S rRNA (pseudouridine(1915)-N(3))-methyltransferase RlmH [Peptoniphilaceae bacterium]MDY5765394.1 23S rRNA (pseudouridine(1915)-N(3))-methyltransferase RlmH [Peptoniphilaceae bacterium]
MNIEIIAVGTVKEGYLREAIEEYKKRLTPYAHLCITEIAEERLPENASPAQILQAMEKEGERIQRVLPKSGTVVSLAIEGKQQDSVTFSQSLESWAVSGGSTIAFVIGGSDGLSETVKKRGPRLSFSKMTFPHQLMRVILLEQIYRGFRILRNEPYHK